MKKHPRHFRLGTTSFIYPGRIIPNVKRLGPVVDEIELLVFESRPYKGMDVLPSRGEVDELAQLSRELDLSYNVHLPVDLDITDPAQRDGAAGTLARVVDLMAPLNPTTHTLHLPMDRALARMARAASNGEGDLESRDRELGASLSAWRENALAGMAILADHIPDLGGITVETLDYPPTLLDPILNAYPVGLCMDVGHHFKYDFDPARGFLAWGDRIPLIHLHGVAKREGKIRDHIGLDHLDGPRREALIPLLADFTGTLSLEVFSLENLNGSLGALAPYFEGIAAPLDP